MADGDGTEPNEPNRPAAPKAPPPGFAGPRPQPPPGFAGPRPPIGGPGAPTGPGGLPPSVVQPLPPTGERASTREARRGSDRRVALWIFAGLAIVAAGVGIKVLSGSGSKVDDATAKRSVPADTTAPQAADPRFHRFVRDYCDQKDATQAAKASPYKPGSLSYTTVSYQQAIGAPGPRTGWFMLNVSPKVGTPEEVSSFEGVAPARLQLATCVRTKGEEQTGINCTYEGDPTFGDEQAVVALVRTRYELQVHEVKTGRVVATGEVATDDETCPEDALVEGGDTVSAPMVPQIITDWFRQHFQGGVPS